MKRTVIFRYSILVILLAFCVSNALAGKQEEKTKRINETFSINKNTQIEVRNKFGEVEIKTWEKNEVQLLVEIIAKGKNEQRVDKILDAIEIDIDESIDLLSFRTDMDEKTNKNGDGFEINYSIQMPATNDLSIQNSFGDVVLRDHSGSIDLVVKYGSLRAGNLTGDSEIELSFGKGVIEGVTDGELTIKYSNLELEVAQKLELTQGFSDVEIETIENLEVISKYGKLEIDQVKVFDGEAHFSGLQIEEVIKELSLECSYLNNFKIDKLSNDFDLLDIEGKFTSLNLRLNPEINAKIETELKFGSLKVDSDLDVDFTYKEKDSNKTYARGIVGKGHETKKIKVELSYGNFRLSEE